MLHATETLHPSCATCNTSTSEGIFGKVLTLGVKTGLLCLIGRAILDSWGAHGVRRHVIEGDTILSAKDEDM